MTESDLKDGYFKENKMYIIYNQYIRHYIIHILPVLLFK